jgi:alkanesulfonate monooxygenase SsuD/methylene tetrahydromethanopterin reductase-like flavin-dependent oxidoreductase (luciferase family)
MPIRLPSISGWRRSQSAALMTSPARSAATARGGSLSANASINADIDFVQFDLDQPIPKLESTASQGALDEFAQHGSGKTLRQLAAEKYDGGGLRVIGAPDRVAARMEEAMQEVGGDGFLISTPFQRTSRRYINEITEGLVPALQRRGLTRTEYTGTTLRETLREF